MFFKIGALKNFVIFTGKYLCWSLFLIKLTQKTPKRFQHRRFLMNIAKFLRTPCDISAENLGLFFQSSCLLTQLLAKAVTMEFWKRKTRDYHQKLNVRVESRIAEQFRIYDLKKWWGTFKTVCLSFHWFNDSWIRTRNSWIWTRNLRIWTCNSWIWTRNSWIWSRTFEFQLVLLSFQLVLLSF